MPRNYHDSDDDDRHDIYDWLTRKMQGDTQPGGAQASGPDWPPPSSDDTQLSGIGAKVAKFITASVLLILTALGIKLGTAKFDGVRPDETPSRREPQQQGVMSPTRRDTSAICNDSTASFSDHRSGTCSGHGGIARWVHRPRS